MGVTEVPSVEELTSQAKIGFQENFPGLEPNIVTCAPGRVNLIGEHTDYNEGFVFPMALPQVTVMVGCRDSSSEYNIVHTMADSVEGLPLIEFKSPTLKEPLTPGTPFWGNYVKGVVQSFKIAPIPTFKAMIISSVPIGGGVSSSASLEVAVYTFLEALTGVSPVDDKAKALACQEAEHKFANMPCGIMDQFISVMGQEGSALLIDCRSLEANLIELSNPDIAFLIINSNVRHKLTGSEYPTRRKHCYEAAAILGKKSLREANLAELEEAKDKMNETAYVRARHVIQEIQRTVDAVSALKSGNYNLFGQLMVQSHNSLRDDFEVSCAELDELVVLALQCQGVHGSRMTGGGFGGCTVTLIDTDQVQKAVEHIQVNYSGKPTFYVSTPSNGARIISK